MNIDKIILENFFKNHIDEAVKTLSSLTESEIFSVIKNLSNKNVYNVFSRIERFRAIKIFDLLSTKDSAEILKNIPAHSAVLIMRQFSQEKLNTVLAEFSDKEAVQFTTMLQYDEFSVGAVMSSNIFTLTDDVTIHDSLESIKRYDGIIPAQIFVVARDYKLRGVVNLTKLIRSNPTDELRRLIDDGVPKLFPQTNIKSIADHKGWQSYNSLPVTDEDDLFLGELNLEIIRSFNKKNSTQELKHFNMVGSALGELYRIGLSGLMRSAAEITTKPNK
jgi:Mg/Co/Ni transporter MgtE